MADVMIQHAGLDGAIEDLQQAANQVINQMDDLVSGLQPLAQTFSGQAADAFQAFQTAVSGSEDAMQQNLADAVRALQDMHDNHRRADVNGAATLGG